MVNQGPTSVHSLDTEALASNAARMRDMLAGASSLLHGAVSPQSVATARAALLEGRALAHTIVEALEQLAAVDAELRRRDHAQAGKHVGEVVR